jgi:hypothetical protein
MGGKMPSRPFTLPVLFGETYPLSGFHEFHLSQILRKIRLPHEGRNAGDGILIPTRLISTLFAILAATILFPCLSEVVC